VTVAVAAVLVLIGITRFGNRPDAAAVATHAPVGGTAAPDFRVTSLDGETFQLSAARGKVVALYFAAAWCPTCVPEAQAWTTVYQQDHARGLEVVMLDVDTSEGAPQWADFRQRSGNGPQLWALDQGLQIASSYGVTSLETSVIVDREGRVAFRHGQTVPAQQLQQEVERLL
jgi:peroxiredoxin